jgi:probable F420-dependent oxidoreductase
MAAPDGSRAAAIAPARLSVRVGVGLTPIGAPPIPSPAFWELIEMLEEVGWDSLWLSDSAASGGLAPLPVLAAVAARTERLKLGTSVLVLPPHNPVLLARELVALDVLSGGRLLPAGGLGNQQRRELEAMGATPADRVARLEECVRVLHERWATIRPRPVKEKLELWLGGRAPAALRRIGRIADGWLASNVGPEEFAEGVATIAAAAAAAGRTIDADHYGTILFSAPSADEIPDAARAFLARRQDLRPEDRLAIGSEATAALLERFLAAGATKFVLMPLATDPATYLRQLHPAIVAPLEARGAAAPA